MNGRFGVGLIQLKSNLVFADGDCRNSSNRTSFQVSRKLGSTSEYLAAPRSLGQVYETRIEKKESSERVHHPQRRSARRGIRRRNDEEYSRPVAMGIF
ncbi:uncharacterized protein LOC125500663 isoform X3 [Athalia rosae]|uniref:uncharacterized protein LOC125500663 isoform X3 n=1 Tax=Athalia rosae TaxID=37344 RepID=UPI0020335051|nr:uncharacterized protein LOC125500663 isoform X3 [Athalia rosae]